jgi:proline iminopeptidase
MAFIKHKFGKTHYTVKGSGKKTPIIWLHGGPGGTHNPKSEVFKLAKGRKVYCYTQIGGGESSAIPKSKWTIATFVEELEILIKAWGLKEFHLMGGSWGTTLALEYYIRKKGKGVKSIVFQSPMFSAKDWHNDAKKLIKKMSQKDQKVFKYCHEIGATDSKVYKDAMMNYYLKHVLRDKKKLFNAFKKPNPNGNMIYEYMWGASEFEPTGTLKTYNQVKSLKKIKVPTLLICGQFDEATPETGIKYANMIPNCAFSEIKGASHAIFSEKPAAIKKVINDFILDIEA